MITLCAHRAHTHTLTFVVDRTEFSSYLRFVNTSEYTWIRVAPTSRRRTLHHSFLFLLFSNYKKTSQCSGLIFHFAHFYFISHFAIERYSFWLVVFSFSPSWCVMYHNLIFICLVTIDLIGINVWPKNIYIVGHFSAPLFNRQPALFLI